MRSLWDQFWIILRSLWDQFWIILVSLWDHCGIISGALQSYFGATLGRGASWQALQWLPMTRQRRGINDEKSFHEKPPKAMSPKQNLCTWALGHAGLSLYILRWRVVSASWVSVVALLSLIDTDTRTQMTPAQDPKQEEEAKLKQSQRGAEERNPSQ